MSPFQDFITKVQDAILTPIITLLALGAFVLFVWGVVLFIASSDDEEKRRTGQQHMMWGIIGLVIIFGANAIVSLLKATVGG
ncbi:pilin [Patescibacteria group bacterium]|nr:pilin [Patescibacteria group bacterium]MBU1500799.1 pilin [Patescibacteria group bacterium]MBU2080854.1 pilin [Patescibacteria group bacterium]MBU2123959.1 pilin [Patescibacteria group bacterium]MBU2194750.1 pilin [Patescibacteria group bacterium]